MSRRKFEDFGPEFFQAINTAFHEGECRIPGTLQEAQNLRANFYHLRRIIRLSDDPTLRVRADTLKFFVDGKGLTIKRRGLRIPDYEDRSSTTEATA